MFKRLHYIFFASNLYSARVILAVAEMIWAVSLAWPGETFGRPTYHVMQMVTTEEVWAWVFMISSLMQWYVVLRAEFNGKVAMWFAAWNSSLWLFVCGSMYVSVYPPPAAISGEFSLALAALWIFARTNPVEDV